jgi:hypothetical protein
MAIELTNQEWSPVLNDYQKEFFCDTDDDFNNLPECVTGSIAVSTSGTVLVVNASGAWVKFGG